MYYKTLAHMIVDSEKSQNLQSESRRPRKAKCTSSLQAIRLKIQEELLFLFESTGVKRLIFSAINQAKGVPSYSGQGGHQSYYSIQAFNCLDEGRSC